MLNGLPQHTEVSVSDRIGRDHQAMEVASASLALTIVISAVHVSEPELVSVKIVWDGGAHNAFTDLIRFKNQ